MESIENVAREGLACVVHMELEVSLMFQKLKIKLYQEICFSFLIVLTCLHNSMIILLTEIILVITWISYF